MARIERKLVAILATDVVGYSRMMYVDEEGTLRRLAANRTIIDGLIEKYGGRIFATGGDSVIAEFSSAANAVLCAVEFQREVEVQSAGIPDEQRLRFRVGINVGDVMIQGDDLLGSGVNIAARLESIADPGGVFISGTAYQYVSDIVDLSFEELGLRKVKNIAEPVAVYRVAGLCADQQKRAVDKIPVAEKAHISATPAIVARHEQAAQSALQADQPYRAIKEYDLALEALETAGDGETRHRFQEARRTVEQRLFFHGDVVAMAASGPVFIRIGESVHVGRSSRVRGASVSVGYKRVSRLGKQCRISYRSNAFLVTDLGSTNGTFLDDRLLEAGEALPLDLAKGSAVLSFGGRRELANRQNCRLILQVVEGPAPALVVRLDAECASPADPNVRENWPTLDEDSRTTWVLSTGAVLIGADAECAVRLPASSGASVRARLDYGPSGFTIGADFGAELLLNGVEFRQRVALADGSALVVGDQGLEFRRVSR